jgi:hypothetical protein
MTPDQAVKRLNVVLAHAWMIRTFLKHADELQASEEMLDVPRTLYDSIRAVEPAFQRGDFADFLRRLRGKLPKLRRASEYFAAHFKEFSPHTNFEMAAASLAGVVQQLEEIFAAVDWEAVRALPRPTGESEPEADPLDDIEIPEV